MLLPHQLGVGVPGAAEAVVHHTRQWKQAVEAGSDESVLLLDFTNAFNSIDRSSMLQAIRDMCPDFYNYAAFCYGSHTLLRGHAFSIPSACGTQQGDACGPLFFAVSVHKMVLQSAEHLRWAKWYLDDGNLCGTHASLQHALGVISSEGAKVGLHLNLNKCKLWGRFPPSMEFAQSRSVPFVPPRVG